ncbi:hypothetical protein A2803_03265 [Candidatus Woesebacteria bacterium RIFCSPHIGHO2_01_FULL_44_21]|uniref:Uncharacterized protein n=1 Tax=Candidatus Woesebacteria bacterium RIFCSPHIGHO2_01_FULL_44_21 TaxID=1802503 RepID=A0A1F7YZ52_9BACT|nr:MAG: hypothetical protein A2803_03265 [Candidatus Woesebacteria bacterium RIFCSPHIGHO2_01_FULL_44_21]OGM69146.1 MAG: hypothetical protein A2897_04975 [Candidatus Woesebacteria bacterium RIFCSPLOWO2_01_FULL_44_24b]
MGPEGEQKLELPTFIDEMFVEDEESGELVVNEKFLPPQKRNYGHYSPEARKLLEEPIGVKRYGVDY